MRSVYMLSVRSILTVALLVVSAPLPASAQSGLRDRYFIRYPFDKWKADGPVSQMKWAVRLMPARLSPHQRLLTRLEMVLDAKEVQKRRGRGEIVIFAEITDAAGLRWRTHEVLDLARIPEDAKARQLTYAQDVFIVPGDYRLTIAVCDSQTQDHSLTERAIHVAPLRSDPLPDAWHGLPAIEYVRQFPQPDVWFQPYLRGRLNVPVETQHPVHVDVIMNMTPSERVAGSVRVFRRNMSTLVPALKILSGMALKNGTLDVTLLDLTTRRIWQQTSVRQLDWVRMREPFANANPGIIDVQSLAGKAEMMQFFRDQIAGKLQTADDSPRVVIVLSAPVFLESQLKAETARLPKSPNQRLLYIRDRPLPPPRPGFFDGTAQPQATSLASDDIERVIRTLGGKVFNVIGPEQFRKALATVVNEIAGM